MVAAVTIVLVVLVVWMGLAAWINDRLGIGFRQAMLYVPFKGIFRIADAPIASARSAEAPIIYVVLHRSRLDPALMLSLLPPETLHILDEKAAHSALLGPWRDLARTIAFNPRHVFVSRRLVRHLRGRGRLAVYLSEGIEPDTKEFRLYRAVGRIALASEARVVAVVVEGALLPFAGLNVNALSPLSVPEMVELAGEGTRAGRALFARVTSATGG